MLPFLVPIALVILWVILCNYWNKIERKNQLKKEEKVYLDEIEEVLDEIEESISNHQKYLNQ